MLTCSRIINDSCDFVIECQYILIYISENIDKDSVVENTENLSSNTSTVTQLQAKVLVFEIHLKKKSTKYSLQKLLRVLVTFNR